MSALRPISKAHLWLGVLLGAQVSLWIASGLVMSWFPIEAVRGEHNAPVDIAVELEARNYANPGGIVARTPGAQEVRLRYFHGRYAYLVKGAEGDALYDAQSGEKLSPVDEKTVREIAKNEFIGDGKVSIVELMTMPPREYRGPVPVWRATISDRLSTRLYISHSTGEVVARRNAIWRVYDFFWMLHIMDYEERTDFNNPLIRFFAVTSLLFALSGVVLVILKIWPGRTYRLKGVKAQTSAPDDV